MFSPLEINRLKPVCAPSSQAQLCIFIMKTIQLMLHIEMKAAVSDNYRKHTKTLSGVNAQRLKVKASGTYRYRYALKTLLTF
jgi:hypothetical protein